MEQGGRTRSLGALYRESVRDLVARVPADADAAAHKIARGRRRVATWNLGWTLALPLAPGIVWGALVTAKHGPASGLMLGVMVSVLFFLPTLGACGWLQAQLVDYAKPWLLGE